MENTHYEPRHRPGYGNGNGRARTQKPAAAKAGEKSRVPVCPYCCESDQVVPILYGYPTHTEFMKADRGEVYLGGCEITPYSHYCKRDDREF